MGIEDVVVLLGNVAWFGAAFQVFGRHPQPFVDKHLPSHHAGHAAPVVYVVQFLGGMNLSLAWLSLFRLLRMMAGRLVTTPPSASTPISKVEHWQNTEVFLASALAHGSQAAFNWYPLLSHVLPRRYPRTGSAQADDALPLRFSKQMMFIFWMDCAMALLNMTAAARAVNQILLS